MCSFISLVSWEKKTKKHLVRFGSMAVFSRPHLFHPFLTPCSRSHVLFIFVSSQMLVQWTLMPLTTLPFARLQKTKSHTLVKLHLNYSARLTLHDSVRWIEQSWLQEAF